ncbi:MAG: Ig-like domain-containing protein [Oxalicibacterium faecigallinarum]|uniref:Ig-like domain-containing protein n=1 Tax=Oxalicibacterium faecigallinarum TaxID=573741 RepID=UPI002807888F|nr:Ig-like domain-containing protein [Oxalicibacterium faecigallinarum]MDQ7968354.1 Ig-like domain-containing protein [Oxalicibacterium faecigallinarum]
MHSVFHATAGDRARRSSANGVRVMRQTAVALAVAGAMPVWAQGVLNEGRTSFDTQPVAFENSLGVHGNGLDLQPLNANNSNLPPTGSRVLNAQIGDSNYAENAKVGLIRVTVAQNSLPADGQTPARLSIQLLDFNGQPVKGTAFVTMEATAGRFLISGAPTDETGPGSGDADRISRGTQVKVVDGQADVLLLAPFQPQDVTVRMTAGRAQAQGVISFVPELREMLAVGLVEGIIKFDSKSPLQLTDARRDDGFEREIRSFSSSSNDGRRYSAMRTAFFLKGKIKGDALLTMAYDSDKAVYDRLFRSIRPDDYYAVYGDSSIRGFEAQSTSKLYVRIDKDRSYLLFGDFNTGTGFSQVTGGGNVASVRKRDLGNYSRTMNGMRGHYDENGVLLNGFVTKDSLLQLVEEFAGQGISGPFAVSKRNAVAGTEKVEIITRDRYQPAVILSVETLQRGGDYSFEPFSGRILLNQPLPSVDSNGNPKSLRVTYEVESDGEKFWVYGMDGQVRLGERSEVGGSYVKDKNPYAPYTLTSANVSFNPTDKTTIVAEVARSQSVLGNGLGTSLQGNPYSLQPQFGPAPAAGALDEINGTAWRVEALHNDDTVQARFFYGRSDPYFNNPSASLAQGREEGALRVTKRLGDQWAVYAEATHSAHQTAGASRDALALGASHDVTDRLNVDVALTHTDEKPGQYANALISAGSGLVVNPSPSVGFGYGSSMLNAQTGYGYNGTNYGLAGVAYTSTGVRIRSNYRVTDKIDLFGEYEHSIDGDSYQRAALGAAYRFSEVGRLYGKYEWMSGLSSPQAANGIYDSNAFVFGADTQYLPNQRVFSEYRLRDSVGGQQLQSASGLRNGWNISETVKIATSAEYLRVYRGQAQDAYALTGAIEWRPNDLWLLSNRLEWRRLKDRPGEGSAAPALAGNDTWLSIISVARKINRDWTFLGRNYLLLTDNRGHAGNLHEDKLQLGVAYRDTDTNRLNVLARYEYWTQRDRSGLNTYLPTYGSDGPAYYPGDPYSSNNEGFDKHIVSLHAEYHPSRPWWFGGRAAAKSQRDYFDGRSDAYRAYLLGGRVTYDITKRWDISGLASVHYSPQGHATQHALGFEAGYQVQDNLWVSAGYNWRGFRDRDLTGSDYTNQGFYVRVRFKFDENLFAGNDKLRNPTLDR